MKFQIPERAPFIENPTPIIESKAFFSAQSDYRVWIKRDDLTGLELSGNKIRKLEFLLADAVKNGADRLITCGGAQSNHCRATAFVAARAGMKSTLFLRSNDEPQITANYLLSKLAGAEIKIVTLEQYENIDEIMSEYALTLSANAEKAYVIPEGGSNHIGAWGYVAGFMEIENQIKEMSLPIEAVVCATGSGGTHAGLLFAQKILNSSLKIISVNVCDSAEFFQKKIAGIATHFAAANNLSLNVSATDVTIIDGYVGEGYGLVNEDVLETIKEFAVKESIILDPVYSAKAVLGLRSQMIQNTLSRKNILFIHTGGIFGLFAYSDRFR